MVEQTHTEHVTRVIAVGNQKGGVGKTTNTVHLAAALGELGRKVLVWDLDVNCGSTRHFGIPSDMNVYGTFELLTGEEEPEEIIITHGDIEDVDLPPNVDLISSHPKLERLDSVLAANNLFAIPQDVLLSPLERLRGKYDYIFLDTAPNLTTPTKAAYKAAQYFILTAIPEPLAMEGIDNAAKYINDARNAGNPNLRLLGVIVSAVPGRRTKLARALIQYIDQKFVDLPEHMRRFETLINASTLIPTAQKRGTTLFQVEPRHKITKQFRSLARELEARFEEIRLSQSSDGLKFAEVVHG